MGVFNMGGKASCAYKNNPLLVKLEAKPIMTVLVTGKGVWKRVEL